MSDWNKVFDQADKAFREADRACAMANDFFDKDRAQRVTRVNGEIHVGADGQKEIRVRGQRWKHFKKFACMPLSALFRGHATLVIRRNDSPAAKNN